MELISRENIIELTEACTFERSADGRPRVPDDILERMKKVTTEEAWGVLGGHGFKLQFDGDWMNIHPGI